MHFGSTGRPCGRCARAATIPLTESPCERRRLRRQTTRILSLRFSRHCRPWKKADTASIWCGKRGMNSPLVCSFPEPLRRGIRWLDTRGLRSSEGCWKNSIWSATFANGKATTSTRTRRSWKTSREACFSLLGRTESLPIPDGALAVDSESVSPRLASPRGDPYVGGSDAGIWRVVKNAVLRTGRRVDTSPPSWELRSARRALRCLRRLTFAASTKFVIR